MAALRKYQFTIVGLLATYVIASCLISIVSRGEETFPFFNGQWFTKVPHTFNDYGIKVLSVNGKLLPNALYLDQKENPFKNSWAFRRYIIAQNLGENIEKMDNKAIQKDISTLQVAIFHSEDVVFQVDRRTLNSLDYINFGKVISTRTIFSSEVIKNE